MTWQEKFFELLFPVANPEIEKAYDLKYEFLPKSIFKYRSINTQTIENLKSEEIWMSEASDFNDPYDTGLTADFERITLENFKSNFDRFYGNATEDHKIPKEVVDAARASTDPRVVFLHYAISKGDIKPENVSRFQTALAGATDAQYKDLKEAYNQISRSHKVIHSFSERNDSILMWSHYADSHRGFLIEYDLSIVPKTDFKSRFMFPVIYSENLLDVSEYIIAMRGLGKNPLYITKAALYKSIDWAYEKEWRWVITGGVIQKGLQKFLPPKALYLGARISDDNANDLKKIAKSKNIPVYKMDLSKDKFLMIPIVDTDQINSPS
jgi:hypothetical protein